MKKHFYWYCEEKKLPYIEFILKKKFAECNFYTIPMNVSADECYEISEEGQKNIRQALQQFSKPDSAVRVSSYDGYAGSVLPEHIDKVVRTIMYNVMREGSLIMIEE